MTARERSCISRRDKRQTSRCRSFPEMNRSSEFKMRSRSFSIRLLMVTAWACVFALPPQTKAQTAGVGPGVVEYKVAGTVVSKTDGHPLAQARISLRDMKDEQKLQSMVTSDDGKFEFQHVLAGKFALFGGKRGFISAA